jgi:hypothetical protein
MITQPYKDLILAEIDRVLEAACSDEAQRADAALMLPRYMTMRNGSVIVADTGEAFSKEWIAAEKAFLLPRKFEVSLADQAYINRSPAARVKLEKQLDVPALDALAQTYGLANHADFRVGKSPNGSGDSDKAKPGKNPFYKLPDKTGAIVPAVQEEINRIIKTPGPFGGTRFVSALAKAARVTLDGRPLRR